MSRRKELFLLGIILAIYLGLMFFIPFGKAVQIGADEGFELAKATLSLKGYKMYTEVWNDQPPLHTYLVTQVLKHVSPSVAAPRLLTVGFGLLLLVSFYGVCRRYFGVGVAGVGAVMLIAAPVFLELSVSCMLELPALAVAMAAVWVLSGVKPESRLPWREVLAGVLVAMAIEIKFTSLVLAPLMLLVLWLGTRASAKPVKRLAISGIIMATAVVIAFLIINQITVGQGFWVQFKQSWASHFAAAKSHEYGSAADKPFDWGIPLRNWDVSLVALVGVWMCLKRARREMFMLVPVIWLFVNLLVFANHKPWWAYYYLHLDLPLCFCAAIGLTGLWKWIGSMGKRGLVVGLGIYTAILTAWMGARLALEVGSIRSRPRIHSSLFLEDIAKYKPYAKFIYTEELAYSFHAGIPMPTNLAVMPVKRFWSGDMTNARLRDEMWRVKPELILLKNEARQSPFSDLVESQYTLIYEDEGFRLFAIKELEQQIRFGHR
jgi:4-amino-4-deoxy-L-arabinose transferase-like glycosyltransferase